ncbi:hypothetical protein PHACT_06005 [Pseudohongiella acticola]|uniref:Tyr recombinase domain-containing protein n=1 Tax=Pseudohongiella acticola TaxID=1524254 RepID=A0A1E8CKC2_9GAMM|nr:site-specific integrase [Pseudohongiella acticola]OFE12745.1 hypothetical protein PHACT_06005 [Pseudohongiella acticola]
MATIRKLRDKWQAQIRLKGIKPIAKSFDKKSDAVNWVRVTESKVTLGTFVDPRASDNVSLSKLIDLYLDRIRQQGRESKPETSRLKRLGRVLGDVSLSRLSVYTLSGYRDQRLLEANPATVIHELSLLTRLLRLAGTDFGIPLPQGVPSIRLPKMPCGRIRRLSEDEEQRLFAAAKSDPEMHDIILLAMECATRRSELLSIEKTDVDLDRRTLTLRKTKSGLERVIPLSMVALEAIQRRMSDGVKVFNLSPSVVSQRFAAISKNAGIGGLRFHDLRHEAVSRFFEKGLTTVEVAAISGHQSLSMLQRYTHIKPEHLVKRLDTLVKVALA